MEGGEHLPRTRQYGNRLSLDDRDLHFHSPAPASLAVNRRMEEYLLPGLAFFWSEASLLKIIMVSVVIFCIQPGYNIRWF